MELCIMVFCILFSLSCIVFGIVCIALDGAGIFNENNLAGGVSLIVCGVIILFSFLIMYLMLLRRRRMLQSSYASVRDALGPLEEP